MKKIALLFVAFAFLGIVAFSSCKSKTVEAPAVDSPVIEQAPTVVDSVATDSTTVM